MRRRWDPDGFAKVCDAIIERFGATIVLMGDAREALSPERAAEVQSALDLVLGALQGADSGAEPAFDLPSQMDAAQLRALTGQCA